MATKCIRGFGIFFLICGIVIFILTGYVQKNLEPNRVEVGIIVDGKYVETDSGYMGRNSEGKEDMNALKGIGLICGALGLCATVGSFFIKNDEQPQY